MKRRKRVNRPPELRPTGIPCNYAIRRSPVSREQAEHRILIYLVAAHGDILMATPLLTALRDAYPTAHLTWIVEHKFIDSIDTNPLLDSVIRWDGDYFRRPLRKANLPAFLLRKFQFVKMLSEGQYDIYISFEPEKWFFIPLALRYKALRIGIFDRWLMLAWKRQEHRNKRFYNHVFTTQDLPVHRTEETFLPLQVLGVPPPCDKRMIMGYRAEDRMEAREFLHAHSNLTEGEPYVVVAPMTNWKSRCWAKERYALLCDRLSRERGCRVVLIGSEKDRLEIEAVLALAEEPHIAAAGAFSFRVMAALIGEAELLISGDTGPMHVAGAVGTPYLALFGATSVEGRAPIVGHGRAIFHPLPCAPCDKEDCANPPESHMLCMTLISVEEAFASACALLSEERLKPQIGKE